MSSLGFQKKGWFELHIYAKLWVIIPGFSPHSVKMSGWSFHLRITMSIGVWYIPVLEIEPSMVILIYKWTGP